MFKALAVNVMQSIMNGGLIFKVLSHSFHNNLEPLQPLTLKHFADVTADVTKVNEGSGLRA